MLQNDHLNQKKLENLQMSNIDLLRTEWMVRYQDDILILQNPHFMANWEPYRMKYLLAVLCHEGSGSGAANLRAVHLRRNSLLITLPSQIVESREVSEDFKASFLLVSERFLSRLGIGDTYMFYKSVENNPLYQLDEKKADAFRSYIELLHMLMQLQDNTPCMEEAFQLLARLFFLMAGWVVGPAPAGKETQLRQGEAMMQFLQLVKLNYREYRDVGFYADKMNISAKYMTTLIKNASGKSAIQWIEDYVILDAKAQLSSTVNSIQQIAYDLNFPSQALFGRYFKRAVGMSPSDYRASLRVYQMARRG